MEKNEIKVGLPINITSMEGFFVISEVDGDKATLYSITNGTEDKRYVDDIEFAVNSATRSMNIIPLNTISDNIDETILLVADEIKKLEESILLHRERIKKLNGLKENCEEYYTLDELE